MAAKSRTTDAPGLTASEAATLVANLAFFKGDWTAHRRFLHRSRSEGFFPPEEELLLLDDLKELDERLQIQRRILLGEIERRMETMQVSELLEFYDRCETMAPHGAPHERASLPNPPAPGGRPFSHR